MLSDIASSCRVDIQRQAMRAVIACTEISPSGVIVLGVIVRLLGGSVTSSPTRYRTSASVSIGRQFTPQIRYRKGDVSFPGIHLAYKPAPWHPRPRADRSLSAPACQHRYSCDWLSANLSDLRPRPRLERGT